MTTKSAVTKAVECSNYSQLYDYVAAGLRDLDDEAVPLLYDENDPDDDYGASGLEDLDILMMESLNGKRF